MRRVFLFMLLLANQAAFFPNSAVAGREERGTVMLNPGIVHYQDGRVATILPDSLPFGPGEIMDYDLKYGVVSMGRARLEATEEIDYLGQKSLVIISRGKTAKWVDSIYKVRDETRSILDLEHMHSLYFGKNLHEGDYRKKIKAVYYHDEGLARYDDGSEVEFLPGSQDILTALYYLRSFPLEPGMSLEIPLHDGKKNYPLKVLVLGRERIETKLGMFDCLLLEPKFESQGLFKSEGRMQIYLSDDDRRVPVLLKAKAPVGAFTSELKAYQKGRRLSVSLEERPGEEARD